MASPTPLLPPLPAIPPLTPETYKSVTIHPSLNVPQHQNNARYVLIGSKTLPVAVASVLIKVEPLLGAKELEARCDEILTDKQLSDWAVHYDLPRQYLSAQPTDSVEERRDLFHAYVGGVVIDIGPQFAWIWVAKLMASLGICDADSPAIPNIKQDPVDTQNFGTSTGGDAPMKTSVSAVSALNELMQQRRLTVTFPPAASTGAHHSLMWTVVTNINDKEYGRASSTDKKAAKEQAATKALTLWRQENPR